MIDLNFFRQLLTDILAAPYKEEHRFVFWCQDYSVFVTSVSARNHSTDTDYAT